MGYEFEVSYNGEPFLIDEAKVIRMNMAGDSTDPPAVLQPPRKYQPESKLVDEINRLMDLGYIQDQAYPNNYPGRNVSALAKQWPINQWPMPKFKLGTYFYPTGATRWSIYRGLMASQQVKRLVAATAVTGTFPFKMQGNTGTTQTSLYQINTDLYMLPPRCLAELGGSFDGLYLITLVDERFYWQGKYVTLHCDNTTTWTELGQQVADALGIETVFAVTSPVYSQPNPDSQIWCNQENAAMLYDVIAYNIGGTVVRQYNGSYNIYQASHSRKIIYTENRVGVPSIIRTAGGDIFSSGEKIPAGDLIASMNAVLPGDVTFTFPKYIRGNDPIPHYLNSRYANPRPTTWYEDSYGEVDTLIVPLLSGGMQFSGQLGVFISGSLQLDASGNPYVSSGLIGTQEYSITVRSTAQALYDDEASAYSGSIPLNASGLIYLGMQLASDYFERRIAAALDETYPGIVNWHPEGIHDILWTYSAREHLATTRIIKPQWNNFIPDLQHATPLVSGYAAVPGVGGHSVAQTWRDTLSGTISSTILEAALLSTDTLVVLNQVDYLPTQNRFAVKIDDEVILLEGTSGGTTISVVQRGANGTKPADHANNTTINWITPNTAYGVNSVRFDKGQFVHFDDWKSGGVQGIVVVPQTQTVQVLTGSGVPNPTGGIYYSGAVTLASDDQKTLNNLENIWVMERNSNPLISGKYYDGQLFAYSTYPSGQPSANTAPIYFVNQDLTSNSKPGSGSVGSGTYGSGFFTSGIIQSGALSSGSVNSGNLASGAQVGIINMDGTNYVNPVNLLVIDNNSPTGFISGFANGRLYWTPLGSGAQIIQSGGLIVSGTYSGMAAQGQLDWQGLRLYQAGFGYVGPCPDMEIIDGTNITTSISGNFDQNVVQLKINATSTVGSGAIVSGMLASGTQLGIVNMDGTNYTNPTDLMVVDNNSPNGFISGFSNGRLYWTPFVSGTVIVSGTYSGKAAGGQLDWQGLRLYQQGTGYVGPCPDMEIIDGTGITTTISGDFTTNRVQLLINGVVLPTPQVKTSLLPNSYTVSGGLWQDTGLTVILPASGKYLLDANVNYIIPFIPGGTIDLQGRIFDSTNGVTVSGSETSLYYITNTANIIGWSGTMVGSTVPITVEFDTLSGYQLSVQARRHDSSLLPTAEIQTGNTEGYSRITYALIH